MALSEVAVCVKAEGQTATQACQLQQIQTHQFRLQPQDWLSSFLSAWTPTWLVPILQYWFSVYQTFTTADLMSVSASDSHLSTSQDAIGASLSLDFKDSVVLQLTFNTSQEAREWQARLQGTLGVHLRMLQWLLSSNTLNGQATIYEACQTIKQRLTNTQQSALVDVALQLQAQHDTKTSSQPSWVGPATAYVSYAWSYRLDAIVQMLSDIDQTTPDGHVYFWLDVVCYNQHRKEQPSVDLDTGIRSVIANVGRVDVLMDTWQAPLLLTRSWCVWEVMLCLEPALRNSVDLRLHLPEENADNLLFTLGQNAGAVTDAMLTIDCRKAQATDLGDSEWIGKALQAWGTGYVNHQLQQLVRLWCYEQCLARMPAREQLLLAQGDRRSAASARMTMGLAALQGFSDYNTALRCFQASVSLYAAVEGADMSLARANALDWVGVSMVRLGQTHQGEQELLEALEAKVGLVQERDVQLVGNYSHLGECCLAQLDIDAALKWFFQALALLENQPAEKDQLAATLSWIGECYSQKGQVSRAIEQYTKALVLNTSLFGESVVVADTLVRLGQCHRGLGQDEEASDRLTAALNVYRTTVGPTHPKTAAALAAMAACYQDSQPSTAIDYHEQALTIRRACLGEQHPTVADSLFDLGDGFLTLKQPRLGLEHHLAALDIRLATLGQEHPHTAASCTAVGHCHQALGQFESAQQSFFQALMIRMTTNGEDHPLVADAYMAVAGCYQAQLQATMATSNYTRALTILDVDPGPQSLAAANCRFQLGQCQAQAGQYAEGLKHLRAALEVRQHGGELDQVLAAHCMALASCYAGLEQPSNALVQYQEAEEYVKATQPLSPALLAQTQCGQALSMTQMNQHMPALTLLDDVQDAVQAEGAAPELMGRIDFVRGCCYHGLSRLQQARASLTNAVSLQVHAFGADHLDIALTLVECGRVYLALEQASQAADCFRRALIIQQAQLGRDHPTTIKTQRLAQLPHATLASASTVAPSP